MLSILKRLIPFYALQSSRYTPLLIKKIQVPALVYIHLTHVSESLLDETILQINKVIIKAIADGKPLPCLVLVIDITFSPDGLTNEAAWQMALEIIQVVDQQYPDLQDRFVGISDDPHKLPLRDLLTNKLKLEEIDNKHLFIFE